MRPENACVLEREGEVHGLYWRCPVQPARSELVNRDLSGPTVLGFATSAKYLGAYADSA